MEYLRSRKDDFLTKAIHNIEENLSNENYSVDELAQSIGLSRSMLHRKLKKITGKSARELITQIRLEKARELLENDVGTSSEIAFRVGFNSPSYFNKVFKKHFGVSPGELRKNPENYYPQDRVILERDSIHEKKGIRSVSLNKDWKLAGWVGITIIAVLLAFYIIIKRNELKDLDKLEKTIAVLPFENFSTDLNESHLGEGLANEIATQLAKIQNFEVRSFTSSLQYKGASKPSMPQIGKELNANFIIEGSVELQNEDISIHVQVIEAKNDRHIWAHDFKGNWNEVLTIRANIAKAVASNLKIILTQEEIKKIETKPTENPDAYNYYLRGNVFYSKGFEKQDWITALNMYNKAIELDPQFAQPYAMIARTHLKIFWFHRDRSSATLEKAREAIETALEINPESGEAYLAYGAYYYHGFLNYALALQYLRKAQENLPDQAESSYYIAAVYRRMGDFGQAEKYFLEAIKLDPNSRELVFNIALNYYLLRDYAVALKYLNKALEINPELVETYNRKIDVYLNKDRNTDNAKYALEEASLSLNISHYPELIEKVIILHLYDGNYQDAIDYLNTTNFEALKGQFYYYPKNLFYAYIYDLMNNSEKAINYYELSCQQIEEKVKKNPEDSRFYSSLGICYAGLNQKEKAIRLGKKAVEILPLEKEAWRGYYRLMELAQIYVMTEEYDLAFEQLEMLLSHPGELSVNRLKNDFKWKPLWDLAEFNILINKFSDQ